MFIMFEIDVFATQLGEKVFFALYNDLNSEPESPNIDCGERCGNVR